MGEYISVRACLRFIAVRKNKRLGDSTLFVFSRREYIHSFRYRFVFSPQMGRQRTLNSASSSHVAIHEIASHLEAPGPRAQMAVRSAERAARVCVSLLHWTRAPGTEEQRPMFQVESYLRYQGSKFNKRFDANCYLRLTDCLDTHNVAKERGEYLQVLSSIQHRSLVVGIDSDMLYPLALQVAPANKRAHAACALLTGCVSVSGSRSPQRCARERRTLGRLARSGS